MVERRDRPIVPQAHPDQVEHRRQLAIRTNASMPKDGTEAMTAPLRLMSYAEADLPDPALWEGSAVYISDLDVIAFSDGVSWVPVDTGANQRIRTAVSVSVPSDFATIQEAWDYIADNVDLAGNGATINVEAGTHTTGLTATKGMVGAGGVSIVGEDRTTTTISVTGGSCLFWNLAFTTSVNISGLKLQTSGSGNCIAGAGAGIFLNCSDLDFGSCAGTHIDASHNADINLGGTNYVSGNASFFCNAQTGGVVALHGATLVFSNSPVFTVFVRAAAHGEIFGSSMTFTNGGTVTGTRFSASTFGYIDSGTAGANLTYFPGNVAGTADAATYGLYY